MSQTDNQDGKDRTRYGFNLALAAVAGQVGCLTTIIIVAAILVGLWIDSRLGTRPTFTIILVLASTPFTLAAMFWIVRKVTSRIQPPSIPKENIQEEVNRGTNAGST
jgi:hypothetical protein